MKTAILILVLISCCGCAAGAATAGYALQAKTADSLSPRARTSIIQEVKDWVNESFERK